MTTINNKINDLLLGSEFLPVLTSILTRPSNFGCLHSGVQYCLSTSDAKKLVSGVPVTDKHNRDVQEQIKGKTNRKYDFKDQYVNTSENGNKVKVFNVSNNNQDSFISLKNSSSDLQTTCDSLTLACSFTSQTIEKSTDTSVTTFNSPGEASASVTTVSSGDTATRATVLSTTASTNTVSITTSCTLAVLQCRKCGAAFLEAKAALAHFKLHLLIAYKQYFCIVRGKDCVPSNCSIKFGLSNCVEKLNPNSSASADAISREISSSQTLPEVKKSAHSEVPKKVSTEKQENSQAVQSSPSVITLVQSEIKQPSSVPRQTRASSKNSASKNYLQAESRKETKLKKKAVCDQNACEENLDLDKSVTRSKKTSASVVTDSGGINIGNIDQQDCFAVSSPCSSTDKSVLKLDISCSVSKSIDNCNLESSSTIHTKEVVQARKSNRKNNPKEELEPPFARLDQVHFHCNFCSFSSTEVLALPVHMESEHLSFSRQVSLRLQAHPQQLHREYSCGECGKKIQGTMSIIQHLLAHDSDTDPYFYKVNKSSDLRDSSTAADSAVRHSSTNNKVPLLSSGFTDLPSSLSELANKSATPLLSESIAKKKNQDTAKRLVDLQKWCPEMVSKTVPKPCQLSESNKLDLKKSESKDLSSASESSTESKKEDKLQEEDSKPHVNGDLMDEEQTKVDENSDTNNSLEKCSQKKDIFTDKGVELVNVRWITEGLLVDGKDGNGWKIVTSNRIVLDDPIDPFYKVDNQSCWRNKWLKSADDSKTRPSKSSEESKSHSSWLQPRNEIAIKKENSSLPFIDGSSGFANGMSTSLADMHRSIGSGGFLSGFTKSLETNTDASSKSPQTEKAEEDVTESTPPDTLCNNNPSVADTNSSSSSAETKSYSEVNSLGVDMMQIEIDPLTLLASAIEEDQKSSNPVIPTEHFLLGKGSDDIGEDESGIASTECNADDDSSIADAPTIHGYATGPQSFGALGYPGAPVAGSYDCESYVTAEAMQQFSTYPDSAGVFQCDVCPKAFKYQYLLLSHRRQVHSIVTKPSSSINKLQNQVQKQQFYQQQLAQQQQLSEQGFSKPEYDGETGLMNGSSEDGHTPLDMANVHPSLKSKLNTGLIINGQVFCPICGKKFVDRASLIAHSVQHLDKSVRCKSCMKEFASKSELTIHIVKYQGTCDPNKSGNVKCATCGEQLPSLAALKEHRRTNHPSPEQILQQQEESSTSSALGEGDGGGPDSLLLPRRGFQCDYCGKNFNCRSNLRDHLVVHTGEKPYPCDICGKTFSFVHNMKTHRLTHNQGRQELCPYCDKSYKSKISLYYHMKKGNCRGLSTTEVPEGYHRCPDCLQMFASEERFTGHKEKGHCHASHRCHHCGLRCSSQSRLDNHLEKGLCKKDPKFLASAPQKKKRKDKPPLLSMLNRPLGSQVSTDDIICERCNYNRDCCCTFTCPACNKRVFSILAYTHHKQKTCPVVRLRREKIRSAIIEKRKKRDKEALDSSGQTKSSEGKRTVSDSESDDELSSFNLSNFSNLGSSVLGYDISEQEDKVKDTSADDIKTGWLNTDIMEGTKPFSEPRPSTASAPLPVSLPETKQITSFKPSRPAVSSKPNKTLTKLKNKAAKMARQNSRMIKKISPEIPIPTTPKEDSKSVPDPPPQTPPVPPAPDMLSASGRRIKRPKKLDNNAYDEDEVKHTVGQPRNAKLLKQTKGDVTKASIKPSNILKNSIKSNPINKTNSESNSVTSNSTSSEDVKSLNVSSSTSSTVVPSSTSTLVPSSTSFLPSSVASTASSLIAANPGKIITLSTSALTNKQLLTINTSQSNNKQSIIPHTSSPFNKIFVRHGGGGPQAVSVVSRGAPQAVLIPAQSFILQTSLPSTEQTASTPNPTAMQ